MAPAIEYRGPQDTRPLDPEFHRDVGQRLAGCRTDDSDQSPRAAQLEDSVLSLGHVEQSVCGATPGPATRIDMGIMIAGRYSASPRPWRRWSPSAARAIHQERGWERAAIRVDRSRSG